MKRTFTLSGGRAIIFGLAISVIMGICIISLITSLLLSGSLPEEGLTVCVLINLILSTFTGAIIAGRGGDTKVAVRIAALGGLYALILFSVGILVLEGPVSNLLLNLLCILIGCACACALCIRKAKMKPRRKSAIR